MSDDIYILFQKYDPDMDSWYVLVKTDMGSFWGVANTLLGAVAFAVERAKREPPGEV